MPLFSLVYFQQFFKPNTYSGIAGGIIFQGMAKWIITQAPFYYCLLCLPGKKTLADFQLQNSILFSESNFDEVSGIWMSVEILPQKVIHLLLRASYVRESLGSLTEYSRPKE